MLVWDSKGIFGSLAEKTQVASPSVTRPGWSNHGRYHTPPAPCCRPIRSRCPGGLRCPQEIGLRNLRSKAKRNKCIIILILILILIIIIIIIIIIIWLSERLPECTFQIHGISLSAVILPRTCHTMTSSVTEQVPFPPSPLHQRHDSWSSGCGQCTWMTLLPNKRLAADAFPEF